jgi:hypothetical protein
MLWKLLSVWDRLDMRRRGGSYLNTMKTYGTYRCFHRSHRLGLRCLRHWTSDSYCGKHNQTCWYYCPREVR